VHQLEIAHCPREETEAICDIFEKCGALSVTFTDKQDDAILEPALGTTPLWPHVVILALFAERLHADFAGQLLSSIHPQLIFSIQSLAERDWERVCLEEIQPQYYGDKLLVCPSWITPPTSNAVTLILDPGLAFGTGTHPTTSLCLAWLVEHVSNHSQMIDYGCGSGILALAAIKLGAAHVNAIDLDEQALTATKNNAATNHISEDKLTIGFPDSVTKPVNLLMANILLSPLISLKDRFKNLLSPNGTLVVSGLLEEQVSALISEYASHFNHSHTQLKDGWALAVFTPV